MNSASDKFIPGHWEFFQFIITFSPSVRVRTMHFSLSVVLSVRFICRRGRSARGRFLSLLW